ncbi:MAG TPA: EAL domain-containing protein [Pseudolabrys sp.]|nr:EAL domain-containing protein [Pseudolabrys sp.]
MRGPPTSLSGFFRSGLQRPFAGGGTPVISDLHAPVSVWDSQFVRLVLTACTILVVVIIAASWVLLANLRSEQIAKANRDLESVALLLAEQIDHGIESVESVQSNVISRVRKLHVESSSELQRIMSGYDTHQRFKDRIAGLSHIDAIVLTDAGDKLINFSRTWPAPPITSGRDRAKVFRVSQGELYVDAPMRSPTNGTWVLPIVHKITSPDGKFIGALIGTIRLSYFERLFRSVARNHDRSIALLTADGNVIARFPRDDALRGHSFADSPIFKDVLSKRGYGTVQLVSPLTGKNLLVSGRKLSHHPLTVVITRRVDDVLAAWWSAALYIAGAAFAIALMVIAVAVLTARQIAFRVSSQNRRLDAALNNMSQGLTMFDANARLIVCNDRFLEIFKLPRDAVKPGCSLADVLRQRMIHGTFNPETMGDPDAYAENVTTQIANGKPVPLTLELGDGRIIAIANRPMRGGGWVATHDDITESRRQAASFQLLFDRNPLPMWVYDLDTMRFLAVNEAAVAHYGYSRAQFMAMTAFDLRSPEEHRQFRHYLDTFNGTDETERIWRHQRADGTTLDVAGYARQLTYRGHRASIVAVQDITQRKLAEEELRRTKKFLDAIVENVPIPILVKDVPPAPQDAGECRYSLVNRAAEEIFGVSRENMIGKTVAEFHPKERAPSILAHNNDVLNSDQPILMADHPLHSQTKGTRIASARSVAIRDDGGKPQHLLTVLQDMTERTRAEQRIARMAHYDSLTDLPNRATFNEAIEAAINKAAQNDEAFAVLSLDLDGFKDANDTYGHAIGDALLREVSRRLNAAADGAFLARIGGDEFSLIVTGRHQPATATAVAERLLTALGDEISIEDRRISIGATIGGAVYPRDGADIQTLMINADIALYRAKAAVRGRLLFFESGMGDELHERRALQADLRMAMERGELSLHYQPQKTVAGEAVGFEALLRWRCPKRGLVSPAAFIPIAEESGLIVAIDHWVLREACREAASWPEPLTVAVNISPMQFRTGDFPAFVHALLIESGLAPSRLELEITEGVLIDDLSRAIATLSRLKALGVRVALDDFGTGYSSLSYLHAFSFDKIKIDRSFIGDIENNRHSMAIVRAVIDLGHSLNIPILAEGVETTEQHAILLRTGCDEVQGYLTGRPLPIDAYANLLCPMPANPRTARKAS